MNVGLGLAELLGYSDHERAKWQAWVAADQTRLRIAFQSGGRYTTLGVLFDHMFLAERRNLARLQGAAPPDSTGIAEGDWRALFDYGELVRADLRTYVTALEGADAAATVSFTVPSGTFTITRRKLIAHMLVHEIRHLAQAAYAARLAGHEPPGSHDILFYPELA
jgi:uncharacterized damage-inducible protein DinB